MGNLAITITIKRIYHWPSNSTSANRYYRQISTCAQRYMLKDIQLSIVRMAKDCTAKMSINKRLAK